MLMGTGWTDLGKNAPSRGVLQNPLYSIFYFYGAPEHKLMVALHLLPFFGSGSCIVNRQSYDASFSVSAVGGILENEVRGFTVQ